MCKNITIPMWNKEEKHICIAPTQKHWDSIFSGILKKENWRTGKRAQGLRVHTAPLWILYSVASTHSHKPSSAPGDLIHSSELLRHLHLWAHTQRYTHIHIIKTNLKRTKAKLVPDRCLHFLASLIVPFLICAFSTIKWNCCQYVTYFFSVK